MFLHDRLEGPVDVELVKGQAPIGRERLRGHDGQAGYGQGAGHVGQQPQPVPGHDRNQMPPLGPARTNLASDLIRAERRLHQVEVRTNVCCVHPHEVCRREGLDERFDPFGRPVPERRLDPLLGPFDSADRCAAGR